MRVYLSILSLEGELNLVPKLTLWKPGNEATGMAPDIYKS